MLHIFILRCILLLVLILLMSLLALLLEVVSRSTPLTLMGEERRPTRLLGGMDPSQEVGWNVDATGPAELEQFSDQLILAD